MWGCVLPYRKFRDVPLVDLEPVNVIQTHKVHGYCRPYCTLPRIHGMNTLKPLYFDYICTFIYLFILYLVLHAAIISPWKLCICWPPDTSASVIAVTWSFEHSSLLCISTSVEKMCIDKVHWKHMAPVELGLRARHLELDSCKENYIFILLSIRGIPLLICLCPVVG